MQQVKFFVTGQPIPKARARVVTKGKRRFAFTPKRVKEWEGVVADEARKHCEKPYDWPVVLTMMFYMSRPASRRLETWVPTTPDLDNLEKAVMDALNGIAYRDDCLVVAKSSSKRYVRAGEPGVEVVVTSVRNQRSLTEFS